MSIEKNLQFRRSVRVYDENRPIDSQVVKRCIELATLAPNSSNMQLWEFYHVTDKNVLQKLTKACFGQKAASTAQQMVVFVTRQDLHKKRANAVFEFEKTNIDAHSPDKRKAKRLKDRKLYYIKVMPFIYSRFFGLFGLLRKIFAMVVGLFRPMMYQVSEADMRVVVHKTCALAAQTFMLAMAEQQYDTCPMEGFDSKMVKKALHLPYGAEVNMIISCGIRKGDEGIWGDRFRVPFDEVYHKV